MERSRPVNRQVATTLVVVQLTLMAALLLLPPDDLWGGGAVLIVIAGILILAGAVLAAWGTWALGPAFTADPIPREHAPLVTGGLYGVIRNPIYSGLLLIGAGLVAVGASVWHIAAWVALAVLLSAKTRWEERMLLERHPDYPAYAARVGRFVPGVGRLRRSR